MATPEPWQFPWPSARFRVHAACCAKLPRHVEVCAAKSKRDFSFELRQAVTTQDGVSPHFAVAALTSVSPAKASHAELQFYKPGGTASARQRQRRERRMWHAQQRQQRERSSEREAGERSIAIGSSDNSSDSAHLQQQLESYERVWPVARS